MKKEFLQNLKVGGTLECVCNKLRNKFQFLTICPHSCGFSRKGQAEVSELTK